MSQTSQLPQKDFCQGPGSSEQSPVDGILHRVIENIPVIATRSVRQRGLIKLLIGIPIAILWFIFQQWIEQISDWLRLLVTGFPGVLALVGIVELVSGIPIIELSRRWDHLKGWQRGLLGAAVAVTFSFIVLAVLYVFLAGK